MNVLFQIALAILTLEYVKNFMDESIEHFKSIEKKDVENMQQVYLNISVNSSLN